MIDMGKLWCLALSSILFLSSAIANAQTYDYIVVGSGPGGGTLAANLAKAGESVLLLEAGDDQGNNPSEEILLGSSRHSVILPCDGTSSSSCIQTMELLCSTNISLGKLLTGNSTLARIRLQVRSYLVSTILALPH